MRHKMMINEFIGRCSSNKGSELASVLAAWRRRSTQLGFNLRAPGLYGFPQVTGSGRCPWLGPCDWWLLAGPAQVKEWEWSQEGLGAQVLAAAPSPPAGRLVKPGGKLGLLQAHR